MTKISPVIVEQHGITVAGIVLIAESHISVHADPNIGRFFIDIFSCTFFDVYVVVAFVKDIFKPCNVLDVKVQNRGHEFPR